MKKIILLIAGIALVVATADLIATYKTRKRSRAARSQAVAHVHANPDATTDKEPRSKRQAWRQRRQKHYHKHIGRKTQKPGTMERPTRWAAIERLHYGGGMEASSLMQETD